MRPVYTLFALAGAAVVGCGGGSGSTSPGTLTVTVTSHQVTAGTSVQASATIGGSPAPNVSWSTSDSHIATVTSTGLITGALKGGAVIYATSGGVTAQTNVVVVPGAPVGIQIVSGSGQTAARSATLPDPLCTAVVDAGGNWLTGITVTYTVATGGGAVAQPTSPATNGSGIAISGLWTLGSAAGQQTVTASASVGSVTFTANAQ